MWTGGTNRVTECGLGHHPGGKAWVGGQEWRWWWSQRPIIWSESLTPPAAPTPAPCGNTLQPRVKSSCVRGVVVPVTQALPSQKGEKPFNSLLWPLPLARIYKQNPGCTVEHPATPPSRTWVIRGLALPHFPSIAAFSTSQVKELRVKPTLPGGLLWAANLVRAAQVLLTGASFLKGPSDDTRCPAQGGRWPSLVSCVHRPRNHL